MSADSAPAIPWTIANKPRNSLRYGNLSGSAPRPSCLRLQYPDGACSTIQFTILSEQVFLPCLVHWAWTQPLSQFHVTFSIRILRLDVKSFREAVFKNHLWRIALSRYLLRTDEMWYFTAAFHFTAYCSRMKKCRTFSFCYPLRVRLELEVEWEDDCIPSSV